MNKQNLRGLALRGAMTVVALGAQAASGGEIQAAGPAPMRDWSGLYLGGSAGGVGGEQTGNFVTGPTQAINGFAADPAAAPISLNAFSRGAAEGVEVGYNFQRGPYVFGVESDLSGIALTAHVTAGPDTPGFREGGLTPELAYFKESANGFAAIRGRAGYAIGNLLLSVSGGPAIAHASLESDFPAATP